VRRTRRGVVVAALATTEPDTWPDIRPRNVGPDAAVEQEVIPGFFRDLMRKVASFLA
jgi:hypothetical protein